MCFFSSPAAPATPPPAPIEPPKIPERAPEVASARSTNKAKPTGGMTAGPDSTFLTGTGGVDTMQLTLGKNTLLGR